MNVSLRDNQCSEKTLSIWQLASVVIREGEESYTTNSCQKCHNDSLKAKGEEPLTNVKWRQVVGKKGVSEKNVENDGKGTILVWDV